MNDRIVYFLATKFQHLDHSLYGENFLKKGIANRKKLCYNGTDGADLVLAKKYTFPQKEVLSAMWVFR